jgi:hypothetical protein
LANLVASNAGMGERVRKFLTGVSVASLLLAGGALLLSVSGLFSVKRTYRFAPDTPAAADAAPMVGRPGEWRYQWQVSFGGGAFQVLRLHAGVNETRPPGMTADAGPYELARGGQLAAATDRRLLGFRYFDVPRTASASGGVHYWVWGIRYLTVPGWFLVLAFALPATMWLRHRRRQLRRASVGLCAACGYDLRASPDRCPECGAAAASL